MWNYRKNRLRNYDQRIRHCQETRIQKNIVMLKNFVAYQMWKYEKKKEFYQIYNKTSYYLLLFLKPW